MPFYHLVVIMIQLYCWSMIDNSIWCNYVAICKGLISTSNVVVATNAVQNHTYCIIQHKFELSKWVDHSQQVELLIISGMYVQEVFKKNLLTVHLSIHVGSKYIHVFPCVFFSALSNFYHMLLALSKPFVMHVACMKIINDHIFPQKQSFAQF